MNADPSPTGLMPGFSGEPAPHEHLGFRKAFRLHLGVVGALMLREVKTRFGRHRLGYIWAFIEPVSHIAFWFAMRSVMGMHVQVADMSTALFLATGVVTFIMFSDVASFVRGSISANRALLAFPIVRNIDAITARFLLESSVMIVVGVSTFALLIFFGAADLPANWGPIAVAVSGMLLLGLGFGTFNSITAILSPAYANFLGTINRFLYFGSGIMYAPESLPPEALEWIAWNPALHGVELFREGWSGIYQSSIADPLYLFLWGAGLLLVGLGLERTTRHIMREQ